MSGEGGGGAGRGGGAVETSQLTLYHTLFPLIRSFVWLVLHKISPNNPWVALTKHSDFFVKMSMAHVQGESIATGKAIAVVDCSAEKALAWIWNYCSYNRISQVKNLRKNPREIIDSISANEVSE